MKANTTAICSVLCALAACSAPTATDIQTKQQDAQTAIEEAASMADTTALLSWADLLARPKPDPSQTIRIGPADTDIVDLWLPDGEGLHPTVIMIHGGCWQKEIADRTLMNYAAEALRMEGIAVWNIEYRGVDEEGGGYPGTFLDVAKAVDALAERGLSLGLATDNVAAIGHSAGGHLALWAAGRHKLPSSSPLHSDAPFRIAGVVNSGGLADLEASAPVTQPGCLGDIMDTLTGAPSEERANVFSDTSPSELLPLGAHQISVNGAQDAIAPPELAKAYTAKATEAGDKASFVIVPQSGHVELITPETAAFNIETAALKSMLGLD